VRPSWLIGIAVVILAFVALGGVLRITHNTYQDVQSIAGQQPLSFGPPALVLDLAAPARPVVTGSFTYSGPGGAFVQPFLGIFDVQFTCAAYAQGASGRFDTPLVLYPKSARPSHTFLANVNKSAYKGPGPYSDAQGDVSTRDITGADMGGTSSVVKATLLLQTRPDGSGSLTFSGPDTFGDSEPARTVSGVMIWTCQDQRIDLKAYTQSPGLP
jgi:hypothetical protein